MQLPVTTGTVFVDGPEGYATPSTLATVGDGNVPLKSPPAVVDIEQPPEAVVRSAHANVCDPPKDTECPAMVMDENASAALGTAS